MSIANKRIFPDQQFAEVGQPGVPLRAGPYAPSDPGWPSLAAEPAGGTAGVMAPERRWDPQHDVVPPDDAGARLFVPMDAKVPSSPPPRLPKIEPPADLIYTHVELVGDLSSTLAFPAHAVIVDNLTNQWLWFPSARRWVPPYIFGVVLPLYQATEIAEYRLGAPATFTQGALHATQYVCTVWTAAMQSLAPGFQVAAGIA